MLIAALQSDVGTDFDFRLQDLRVICRRAGGNAARLKSALACFGGTPYSDAVREGHGEAFIAACLKDSSTETEFPPAPEVPTVASEGAPALPAAAAAAAAAATSPSATEIIAAAVAELEAALAAEPSAAVVELRSDNRRLAYQLAKLTQAAADLDTDARPPPAPGGHTLAIHAPSCAVKSPRSAPSPPPPRPPTPPVRRGRPCRVSR